MIIRLRKSFGLKVISVLLLLTTLTQWFAPLRVYALTSGPSQPEVHGFEPVGTSEMVDLFSGDFNYNIPLLDVDGYPINLCYHSGVSMDQEASWVGLGWSLNPGVVNRNIRGIPDDFSSLDKIQKESNLRPNETYRVDGGLGVEAYGFGISGNLGLYYNNYKGMGYSFGLGASMSYGPVALGAQLGFDTEQGIDFNPSLSFSKSFTKKDKGETTTSASIGGGISMGFNSRAGLKHLTFSASVSSQYMPRSVAGTSSISFSNPTYTPNVTPSTYQTAFTFTGKFGGALYGVDLTGDITVSYAEHGISRKNLEYPAYGYLYADVGTTDVFGMQDVTREKETGFSKFTKYLPISTHAYDVYSVSGQGTGGSFRPYRGNIGTLFDPRATNENWPSVNLSIEAAGGPPPSAKIGANIKVAWTDIYSGIWVDKNYTLPNLTFRGETVGNTFEPVYFKNIGEKSINDTNYYNKFGNTEAVRVALSKSVADAIALPIWEGKNGVYPIDGIITRGSSRDRRNMPVYYLTADIANTYALDKKIRNYTRNSVSGGPEYDGSNNLEYTEIVRTNGGRKENHISEITTLNPDGTRYIYGIPAYNFVQYDKSFNVNNNTVDCATGLVSYTSGVDNSMDNQKGVDYFYNSTKLPPFAHSYLLTAVLSPDYIDITGNGPSDDDYGKYTRFNYAATSTGDNPYKWRTPYYGANHNEGYKSDNSSIEASYNLQDDKASYVYGEKEVWHLSSIETRNYIAEFYTSPRRDAFGVDNENQTNPGHDTTDMGAFSYKLDSIRLFSKHDILANGSSAVPIKVVHFSYTYDLCKNVPNNASSSIGKLTLSQVWFTYGNSSRGSLNKYVFNYGNLASDDENPDYNMKSYDRWGNYKPNSSNCSSLQNADFPYVDQDKDALVDVWASAWSLKSITLPSGGEIDITYEADDYAYVQNRESMQMMKIIGFDSDTIFSPSDPDLNSLFQIGGLNILPRCVVYFRTPESIAGYTKNDIYKRYIRNMNYLYYNCLTNLTDGPASERSDYIAGYCEFENVGCINDTVAFIKMKEVPMGDRESNSYSVPANPISKAALQFLRVNRPDLAYPPSDPDFTPSIMGIFGAIGQFFDELQTIMMGFNRNRMLRYYAQEVNVSKSWIRLHEPSGFKKGGGCRVQKIEISDKWDDMTSSSESSASYGQEYDYTIVDSKSGLTISSGVASYEPSIGGDENPWRQPVKYEEEIAGAPNNEYYTETPLGESYFPGASIGYRKVTVTNIKRTGIRRHATGKSVNEFYTAAEFPTITRNTPIETAMAKPWSPLSFFGLFHEEYATASQGYCIELNDMHGKPKAQWVYSETDNLTPISGVEYKYNVEDESIVDMIDYSETKLNNEVTVLLPNGTYTQKIVGEEIDMVMDANDKKEENYMVGAQINFDIFLVAIFPIGIPMILPEFSYSVTRVKTVVATKVVNRAGILTKTIAHDNGATLETENIAWDSETGEVLLTRVQNEYRDNTFNLTYPAHWAYDKGMGQAYKNIGLTVNFSTSGGQTYPSNATLASQLVPGDELAILEPSGVAASGERIWVLDVYGSNVSFVYRNGFSIPDGSYKCKVIRSGRRNMQTLPMMSVSTRSNPLWGGHFTHASYDTANVLNSSGVEYSQDWQKFSTVCEEEEPRDTAISQYLGSSLAVYYVDAVNQLILQDRLFTNGAWEYFNDDNFWPVNLTDNSNISNSILHDTCDYRYATDDTSGTVSAVTYPAIKVTVNNLHSCSLPGLWSYKYYVYSTDDTPVGGSSFYDHIAYIIPGAYINSGLTVPANMASIAPTGTGWGFYLTAVMDNGTYLLLYVRTVASAPGGDGNYFSTSSVDNDIFCCPSDSLLNPYIWNLRGNWRPLRNFVYYDKRDTSSQRSQSIVGYNYNTTNTRYDGTLINYSPLWYLSSGIWTLNSYNGPSTPWVWQTMITQHSSYSELENKDALNIYSAALMGYNFSLPTAVAKNAMLRQIAYDGFEDYEMSDFIGCNLLEHFNFKGELGTAAVLETLKVHSGKYALKVNSDDGVSVVRNIQNTSYTTWSPGSLITQFYYKPQHLVTSFSPLGAGTYSYGSVVSKVIDGKYLLSYWVSADDISDLPNNLITIRVNGSPVTLTSTGNDQAVEGWKRIERKFTIAGGATSIEVLLDNSHSDYIYYDDIRIHPVKSSMVTYVYDAITQRLMAQLDDNNYATFYEYDEQGNLVRIKKETERGIMTIQESRQNMANQ